MALQLVVDSLDGMDDSIRSLYVESNGKFTLDVDGIDKAESVQTAIRREREARKEAEKRLKELGNLSREDIDELESLRAEAAKARGAEDIVNQLKARHQKELEAREKQAQAYRASLEKTVLESTASKLLAEHKGNVSLLMPHIQSALRVEEADGQFQVVPANAASLEEVVTGLKSTFPQAFSDSGHSGGGAPGGGGGGGIGKGKTISRAQYEQMTPAQRTEHFSAGGGIAD
ncbi:MAG TPA: hypothetical protein VLH56_18505 [Dissulfurispiraceae bacterium]|nr:hypothetical protein [Dissulfurispiraceae bacterium]